MTKPAYFIVLTLFLSSLVWAGPSDSVTTGDISDSSKNTGNVISIGGGTFTNASGGGKLSSLSGTIGSVDKTETDVGSIDIKGAANAKVGAISDSSKNAGTVVNVGSKVEEGSVTIGD